MPSHKSLGGGGALHRADQRVHRVQGIPLDRQRQRLVPEQVAARRGGRIGLEFEKPGVEKRDGFGRLLAYVIAGGVNVNLELVRQGWSAYYTKYGKGRLRAEFEAAEREARTARRGLWRTVQLSEE